jgi:hypothetical protein
MAAAVAAPPCASLGPKCASLVPNMEMQAT